MSDDEAHKHIININLFSSKYNLYICSVHIFIKISKHFKGIFIRMRLQIFRNSILIEKYDFN